MSTSRPSRKLPRDAYFALRQELETLKNEGAISPERFEAIAARYATPANKGDFGSLVFLATTTLGVLAFGFAAFLVLRYNWAALSAAAKTAIVCGATALAYLGAEVARRFDKTVLAEICAFGGAIMFGVDVWQLAQIYQFDLNFPQGSWVWALGVFLLAVFSRLPILHYLAVAVLVVWTFGSLFESWETQMNGGADVVRALEYSAPIFAAFGYVWGVRRAYPSVSALYLVFLSFWTLCQTGGAHRFFFPVVFATFFGGLLWFFGDRFVKNRGVARTAKVLGAAFVLVSLLFGTTGEAYRSTSFVWSARFFVEYGTLALLAIGAGIAAFRRKPGRIDARSFWSNAWSPSGVALATTATFAARLIFSDAVLGANYPFGFWAALYANVLAVAIAWYFICTGATGRPARYWIGVLYFIVWSIVRYVDLFGDFGGVLGAAYFFLGVALALFAAAFLFQTRIRRRNRVDADAATENASGADETTENSDADAEPKRKEPNALVLRIGYGATIFLQFAILFGIVAAQTAMFSGAKTILVETAPVDPTDLFRGDYVVLRYPFSSLLGSTRNDLERPTAAFDVSAVWDADNRSVRPNVRTVYARLKLDPTDGVFKPVALTPTRPENLGADEIAIRGRRQGWAEVRYGIETFFVQEGTGREIENARFASATGKKALVELLVASNGKARVANVKLVDDEGARPAVEAPNDAPNNVPNNVPNDAPTTLESNDAPSLQELVDASNGSATDDVVEKADETNKPLESDEPDDAPSLQELVDASNGSATDDDVEKADETNKPLESDESDDAPSLQELIDASNGSATDD